MEVIEIRTPNAISWSIATQDMYMYVVEREEERERGVEGWIPFACRLPTEAERMMMNDLTALKPALSLHCLLMFAVFSSSALTRKLPPFITTLREDTKEWWYKST